MFAARDFFNTTCQQQSFWEAKVIRPPRHPSRAARIARRAERILRLHV